MTNKPPNNSSGNSSSEDAREDDADVRRLLQAAGPRAEPAVDVRDRVHSAVLDEWRKIVNKQTPTVTEDPEPALNRYPKLTQLLSLAATVLVGTLVWVGVTSFDNGQATLAAIKYSSGDYNSSTPSKLEAGTIITTETNGSLMLEMRSGVKISIGHSTSLNLVGEDKVSLTSGRIYVDSQSSDHIVVLTEHARITDIGTLFEVSISRADSLSVAVREGEVNVDTGDTQATGKAQADRGELLLIRNHEIKRQSVSTLDERWNWVQNARPALQLSGTTVHDYLLWVARDTGRTLQFADRSAEVLSQHERFSDSAGNADEFDLNSTLATTSQFSVLNSSPHVLLVGLVTR